MKLLLTVNVAWNFVNFRRALIEGLVADGHEVVALCPADETTEKLEALGCRVVDLQMDSKGLSPIRDLNLMLRMREHFRRERPDVVLSYTIKNNVYGAIAARPMGIPVIPNVTGLGTAFLSGRGLAWFVTRLYRLAFQPLKRVAFQNTDDRDLFLKRRIVRPDQVMMVPGSGIDLDRFQPAPLPEPGQPLKFLLIGRLLRDKGVVEYVEAARILKARGVNARFQLLGAVDAVNRTALDAATVAGWVEEGVVEHLGTTDDVRPVIAASDCVVLPSYREGTPRTLLEAAAMARPCVATDVPGCRQVVEDGKTGLLCRVRDAQDLADKMANMIAMGADGRRGMGLAGRARVERTMIRPWCWTPTAPQSPRWRASLEPVASPA